MSVCENRQEDACVENAVEYDITDTRISLQLNRELSERGYEAVLACLANTLTPETRTLFVDKRGFKRSAASIEEAKSYGKRFGDLLQTYRVRAALVIDPKDFYETAMCVFAMESGAKIMTTDSVKEANLWLDGFIN